MYIFYNSKVSKYNIGHRVTYETFSLSDKTASIKGIAYIYFKAISTLKNQVAACISCRSRTGSATHTDSPASCRQTSW